MRNVPLLPLLAVAVGSALLCLPFLGACPFLDPDEGYYPAAAAESLREGHPLDPTLDGEPRWNKPPLSYALMEASMALLGRNESAARLPSVLEGAALAALLGLLVARAAGGRAGLLAAVVLAASLGHQAMSRAAHPEMGLVLGTAVAQGVLALWIVSPSDTSPRRAWPAAGLAMAFGFLAKGPAVLAMPALMLGAGMLLLPREGRPSWREAGRVFGLATLLCLAVAAPWFLWMGHRHGAPFWREVLGQVGNVAGEAREGFRASPLFFVPVLAGALLPWTGLLPHALRGLRRSDPAPAGRFALLMALAAGTSFLFWSLSAAKNPHYALVFLPPLAALLGIRLAPLLGPGDAGPGRPFAWGGGLLVFAALALFAGAAADPGPDPEALRPTLLLGGGLLLAAGLLSLLPGDPRRRFLALAAAGALLLPLVLGLGGGWEEALPPARRAGEAIRGGGAAGEAVAVYRARLPSLSFYAGRRVERPATAGELGAFLRRPGRSWLLIRAKDLPDLDRALGIPDGDPGGLDGYARTPLPGDYVLLREP